MVPESEAFVIPLFVQSVMFGSYMATLAHCLRWLIFGDEGWKMREKINWGMLIITILVFLFSTANLGISLQMTLGFFLGGDLLALNRMSIANTAIEFVTILITDAVLIYRCWIVYAKSWKVVSLPLLVWLADAACAIAAISLEVVFIGAADNTWNKFWFLDLQEGFYSGNIAINLFATAAIILRIVRIARRSPNRTTGRLYSLCLVLAESGILYSITSALNLITAVLDTEPKYDLPRFIFDAINFSTTGITFNLILVRVGHDRANPHESIAEWPIGNKPRWLDAHAPQHPAGLNTDEKIDQETTSD